MAELRVGANLPWIAYGQDFGASAWRPLGGVAQADRGERMRQALATLAGAGAGLVRWWLLGDGRSGLRVDADGHPLGLDDAFFADLDAAIEALRASGLKAVFVLVDFLWFAPPSLVSGVQTGGRRELVASDTLRAELVEKVFAPIARRYANEAMVAAWDLFNEPDWSVFGLGTLDPRSSIQRSTMRRFLADLASVFRREGAKQPLTVGLARASSLPLVDGLDLDLYQMHWYETADSVQTLAEPVASRGLDRPLLLGEFPTVGASVGPRQILKLAAAAGYWGALAWSLLAKDTASEGAACEATLVAWSGGADRQQERA